MKKEVNFMDDKKEIVVVLLMLLVLTFSIGISVAQNETNVSEDSVDDTLDDTLGDTMVDSGVDEEILDEEPNEFNLSEEAAVIILDKDKYIQGEKLEGKVKFIFNGPINLERSVTLRVVNNYSTLTMAQVLENASKNFTVISGRKNKTDPAASKTLYFSESGQQMIGVEIPGYSDVHSVSMNVSGPPGNSLRIPRLDIGDDGEIDWYYLGELTGFSNLEAKPEGLNDAIEGSKVLISDNDSIYCQKIDLPFGTNFKVAAKYKKVGSAGDLKAMILAPFAGDFSFPQGGADRCDLPEETTSGYHECAEPLRLPYAAKGDFLVCIFNAGRDEEGNEYELRSDNSDTTNTAFRCEGEVNNYGCSPVTQNDFFIKVIGGDYYDHIDKQIDFGDYELGPDSVLVAFRKIVGSVDSDNPVMNFMNPICKEPKCIIPITVYANNSGEVTFSNLEIGYTFEGVAPEEGTFYSVIEEPPVIDTIDGVPVGEGFTFEVPLDVFGLILPGIPSESLKKYNGNINIDLEGADYHEPVLVSVYRDEIPPEPSEELIINAKASFDAMLQGDDDMQFLLDKLDLRTAINSAQQELSGFEDEIQQSGPSEELRSRIEASLASAPKEIREVRGIKDIQLIDISNIDSNVAGDLPPETVYALQDKVTVTYEMKTYIIEDYSGTTQSRMVMSKKVVAKEPLKSVDVFEVIPKDVAYSTSEIVFERTPEIVQSDPIVRWFVQSMAAGKAETFRYIVESETATGSEMKTIVIPSLSVCGDGECESDEDEDGCPEDCAPPGPECGDGLCEEGETPDDCPDDCKKPFPIIPVIIGVLIVAGGVVAFLFKDKIFVKKRGPSPFKSERDLKAIMGFVAKARKAGKRDEDIEKMLTSKGWKKEHVAYAIEEIELRKKEVAEKKKGKAGKKVDLKPIQDYIDAARKKGIKDDEIKKTLLKQGWDKETVELAFKK